MKKDTYVRMMEGTKADPNRVKFVCSGNGFFTKVVYVVFILLNLWLFIVRDERVIRILLTTAISFLALSVFRKIYNKKRPYEEFGIAPVIPKDKKGNSFPSRHVFSAFVIAMACLYINIWFGVVMLFIAAVIAAFRVIGGVHYPSDVIVGGIIGIISGILGFYIL